MKQATSETKKQLQDRENQLHEHRTSASAKEQGAIAGADL